MQRSLKILALLLAAVTVLPLWSGLAVLFPPQLPKVDFTHEIQPIFQARCAKCHGGEKQMAQLNLLDQRSVARVVIAGNSKDSRLVRRISGLNNEARMPKDDEPLKAEQIELIKRWIDEGADYPAAASFETGVKKHWAFVATVRPPAAEVKNKALNRNPIDAFILARLEKENLTPSPEADKITLLRRLSLDLIGLPPTPEEVDAFLKDASPQAYEKQVERLLASPHYGERWGRLWLDAARYADSDGFEKAKPRSVSFYRDWVIKALNQDKPYDQFIIEQVAGDLLPGATQEQRVATGFLRNSMINEEGGVDPEQFRMEAMFDRMDALGKGVLGLTIQCAQCHTHKYDPLTQEEYYRLFAWLNNDHEARPVVYAPAQQRKIADLRSTIGEIEQERQHRTPDWEERMTEWEKTAREDQPEWIVFGGLEQEGDKSQRYEAMGDGSLLACGYAPTKFTQWFRATNDYAGITAFRLELLTDPDLPYGGPGRAFNGTCALSDFLVEATELDHPTNKVKVKWADATADYNQPERKLETNFDDKTTNARTTGPIQFAIDGNGETAWGINAGPGRRNQERKAVFVPSKSVGFGSNTYLRIGLQQNHGGWNS